MTDSLKKLSVHKRRPPYPGISFPIGSFTVALVFSIVTFGLLVWYLIFSYKYVAVIQKDYFQLSELKGKIAQYDEALTMSASMAAASGNPVWEARYNKVDTDLVEVINQTYIISRKFDLENAVKKTDLANQRLIAMEREAFSLVHQGYSQKALSVLNSETYKEQKALYSSGIDEITTTIGSHLKKEVDFHYHLTYVAILLFVIILPCLIIVWIIALRAVRKYNENRSKNEAAVKESETTLAELNATKDKFFSIVAHDLKSPFNSILGFSKFLKSNFREIEEEKLGTYLAGIETLSQQAYNLLENLLVWARSQMGGMEFKPEKMSLKSTISGNINLFLGMAENKKILIINDVKKDYEVFADPNMTDTVLRNLIANAIKFTAANGNIQISANAANDWVQIIIKDSGIGIAEEDMDKLFKLDARLRKQGTSQEKGTGLGLILCKEFVEKQGGSIWVESQPGIGSSFVFTLPLAKHYRNSHDR